MAAEQPAGFWSLEGIAALVGLLLGWIVTIATTRRQLLDHIRECDRRHAENLDRLNQALNKLDQVLIRLYERPAGK